MRVRQKRAHVLEQTKGPGSPRRFPLERDLLRLGRNPGLEVHLDSEEVSRTHARLLRADDEYTIEDSDSRNGIYLNGLKVHAAVLRDGDELQLGDVFLTYHEGS